MTDFNYDAPAEFYGWRGQGRGGLSTYRRFATAAEAIRHAIEDVSSAALGGCALEANGTRIQGERSGRSTPTPSFPCSEHRRPDFLLDRGTHSDGTNGT